MAPAHRFVAIVIAMATAMGVFAQARGVRAEDVEFAANLDSREYYENDEIRLTVVVVVPAQEDVRPDRFPDWGDLVRVGHSQSSQTSVQMGGGRAAIARTISYVFTLRAPRPGRYIIRPGVLRWQGRTYQTQPQTLTVKKGRRPGPPPGAQRPRRVDPFGGLFDDPFGQAGGAVAGGGEQPRVFARAELDPPEPWVGQEVTLTVRLYANVGISSDITYKLPQFDDFWVEALERRNEAEQRRIIDGVRYAEYVVTRQALFPLKAGALAVGPVRMTLTAMSGMFGQRVNVDSEPVTLKVKALPEAGRPPGFHAANVGRYALRLGVDRVQVPAGEPVTVQVILSGEGNIGHATLPTLPAVGGVKLYPPTVRDEVARDQARLAGQRVAEYLLVPPATGVVRIPALSLPVFDPGAGRYQVLATQPLALHVTAGAGGAAGGSRGAGEGAPGASSAGSHVIEADALRPMRYDAQMTPAGAPLHRRGVFWGVVAAPPLGLLALWGTERLRAASARRAPRSAPRRAVARARRRLALLRKEGVPADLASGYAALARILLDFVADRFGQPAAGLTMDSLQRLVAAQPGVDARLAAGLVREIERLEHARFSPDHKGEAELSDAMARVEELVRAFGA